MRKLWMICLLCMLFLWVPNALADHSAHYSFQLEHIPAYGVNGKIGGDLVLYGPCRDEDLYIKSFIQVPGSDEWWPKPTADQPYIHYDNINFFFPFITGGDDIHAVKIVLMLVREPDKSLTDYAQAEAAALCVAEITRTPAGAILLRNSCRDVTAVPLEPGINVGFYVREGTAPGDPLSETEIRRILQAAASVSASVRFYAAGGEIAKAYPIAHEMGFRIAGTAWLDGSPNDQAEMDALIDLCNRGWVSVAFVGNEAVLSGSLTVEKLIQDIEYVRKHVTNPAVIITTAEGPSTYDDHPELIDACDQPGLNIHPYWNGTDSKWAAEELSRTAFYAVGIQDKQMILSEAGWPTAGSSSAGESEQEQYLFDVDDLLREGEFSEAYLFSLADEPWKAASEGAPGAHWGLLDSDLYGKRYVLENIWAINSPTVFGGAPFDPDYE